MANREGLTSNDEYHIFVNILQEAIHIFETDRQSFYREYTSWRKDVVDSFGKDSNIRADAVANMSKKKAKASDEKRAANGEQEDSNETENSANSEKHDNKYTDEEYQETVYRLMKENEEALNAKQILQMLSSSGLILNTFFHEFRAVQAEYGSRAPQLRRRINYMIDQKNLHPGFVFDPFLIIDQMEHTDEMLELWLKVAMDGVLKASLELDKIILLHEISNVVKIWQALLKSKNIHIQMNGDLETETEYEMSLSDLFIIMNNFLLNSVYFLEKEKNIFRKIVITLKEETEYYLLNLWNNGPMLDEKFKDAQDRIFELGETSKPEREGTGIGLWIMKETIERYDGIVTVSEQSTGFGLDIYLKKKGEN